LPSEFSAGLVLFTTLVTVPAVVFGLRDGIRKFQSQREGESQTRRVERTLWEVAVAASGFAFGKPNIPVQPLG
jgi:hypothetical protein